MIVATMSQHTRANANRIQSTQLTLAIVRIRAAVLATLLIALIANEFIVPAVIAIFIRIVVLIGAVMSALVASSSKQ